jgi:hypothetical protein
MEYTAGPKRWRVPELRNRNVSTQIFLVPNVPGKLGVWEHRGTVHGDYVFIEETARLQGEPVFVDEVTVRVRPIRNPLRRLYVRARYRAALGTRARRVLAGLGR